MQKVETVLCVKNNNNNKKKHTKKQQKKAKQRDLFKLEFAII